MKKTVSFNTISQIEDINSVQYLSNIPAHNKRSSLAIHCCIIQRNLHVDLTLTVSAFKDVVALVMLVRITGCFSPIFGIGNNLKGQ